MAVVSGLSLKPPPETPDLHVGTIGPKRPECGEDASSTSVSCIHPDRALARPPSLSGNDSRPDQDLGQFLDLQYHTVDPTVFWFAEQEDGKVRTVGISWDLILRSGTGTSQTKTRSLLWQRTPDAPGGCGIFTV